MGEGVAGGARVVVLHQDDVGMCHGANTAFRELRAAGVISSGSVMVPCPWFPEMAEVAAADPELDLGVHLTLNAEKPHYRWGPLTRPSPAAGLTDDDGYLWRTVTEVRRHAHPEAVEAEFRAQVDRALGAGIDVTHLDAHMGAALGPEFCDAYLQVGVDYRLPILLTRELAGYAPNNHLVGVDEETYAPFVTAASEAGMPLFDRVGETSWDRTAPAPEVYREMLGGLEPGLTFVCLHPNAPGELEFIEPESAHIRTDEYELLGSDDFRSWLDDQGFELVGMRGFRDRLRGEAAGEPA